MKIHDCEQGSELWFSLRSGIPTASEFHNLLTPKFEIRKGQTPQTFLAAKIAEWWMGGPLPGFSSWATDQGKMREQDAIPWLELQRDQSIQRVGFCTTDDGLVGCSPDGLFQNGEGGIEIKCPEPTNAVKYLLSGDLPDDYAAQVHGSMWVTGLKRWMFLSYRPGFPKFILPVESDPEIEEKISEALALFLTRFESAKLQMIERNGGPPRRKPEIEMLKERVRFTWESDPNEVPIP